MVTTFGSFDQSELGVFIQSQLGARGDGAAGGDGSLQSGEEFIFIAGDFTGGVMFYNPVSDEWVSMGLGESGKSLALFEGKLYAGTATGIKRFSSVGYWIDAGSSDWSGAPIYFEEVSGTLYASGDIDPVQSFTPSTLSWSEVGTGSGGLIGQDSSGLWNNNKLWGGASWSTKSTFQYGAGAGAASIGGRRTLNNGKYYAPVTYPSGGDYIYAGYYSWDGAQWSFTENTVPIRQNIVGSASVTNYVYDGIGTSSGWSLNPADNTGDTIPFSSDVRVLFVNGNHLIFGSTGTIYKGANYLLPQTAVPMTTVHYAEVINNEVYVVGDHSSNGRVQIYNSVADSYSDKGATSPDDDVRFILSGTIDQLGVAPSSLYSVTKIDKPLVTIVAGPLTITSVIPPSGTSAGGASVIISGTGFTASTTVDFDGNAATGVSFLSSTALLATTPAGTGTVDVVVNDGGDTDTLTNGYTYT